jgi:calcineurin-like phosphoesterase family protein
MNDRIFFTSDLHFGHDKDFIYKPRGVDNIQAHDKLIIINWNRIVEPEDTVYILGDLMLGSFDTSNIAKINALNGNKKIILGNHDTDNRIELYKNNLINTEVLGYGSPFKYGKYKFFLSHYPTLTSNCDETNKKLKNRTINLCGHTHTNNKYADMDRGLIYHVELNAHNMQPVLIDKIIEDIRHYIGE